MKWFVEGFSKRSEMKVDLEMPDSMPRFSEQAEMALFRVIQESLSNALRHSGSHVAFVQIRNEDHKFSVEIRDQGHGFDTSGGNGEAHPTVWDWQACENACVKSAGNSRFKAEPGAQRFKLPCL